jgi:hypothetical protein
VAGTVDGGRPFGALSVYKTTHKTRAWMRCPLARGRQTSLTRSNKFIDLCLVYNGHRTDVLKNGMCRWWIFLENCEIWGFHTGYCWRFKASEMVRRVVR